MDILDRFIEINYVVMVLVVSRFLTNWVPPLKQWLWLQSNIMWGVLGAAALCAVPFWLYQPPGTDPVHYAVKMILSYCAATSAYEILGKKVFEFVETNLADWTIGFLKGKFGSAGQAPTPQDSPPIPLNGPGPTGGPR